MNKKNLYFAYGSNLNQEDLNDWKARKPHWKNTDLTLKIKDNGSIGYLAGYRLGFTKVSPTRDNMGVADIVRVDDTMSRVWGVIFSLTNDQRVAIAEKEGAPNFYKAKTVDIVYGIDGESCPCQTYEAVVPDDKRSSLYFRPSKKYYEVIRKGGEDHELPREFFYHLRMVSEAAWIV